ncbi:MAG: sulfatase-like hydrolase/transferase, partial [Muribaculaceae bacterium]|nr:sulfatase-like hydrolase/transferase [Muribaculaceae bacterium]
MKNKTILTVMAAVMTMPGFQSVAADQRPNIVLFMVDDMGWQDTSLPFYKERTPLNDRYRTPNMERLAEMGVKFTQAYACAISSPSRCSLMTGMNQARHRVTNWTLHKDRMTDDPMQNGLTLPDWNY